VERVPYKSTTAQISTYSGPAPSHCHSALRSPGVAGITVGTTNAAAWLTGEDRGILRVSQVPSKAAPVAEARVISEKCQKPTNVCLFWGGACLHLLRAACC
jgi:hypothetical protein